MTENLRHSSKAQAEWSEVRSDGQVGLALTGNCSPEFGPYYEGAKKGPRRSWARPWLSLEYFKGSTSTEHVEGEQRMAASAPAKISVDSDCSLCCNDTVGEEENIAHGIFWRKKSSGRFWWTVMCREEKLKGTRYSSIPASRWKAYPQRWKSLGNEQCWEAEIGLDRLNPKAYTFTCPHLR